MYDDIETVVDKKFWRIINDLRVHTSATKRAPALSKLKVTLHEHRYFPNLPIAVKEVNKGFGVARQIPIFNLQDYSVYYYCVRRLESVLAKNRVPGTYGGWSMGGKIRRLENAELPEEYPLTYSYNPAAWAKYYGEFNGKLFGKINELKSQNKNHYLVYEIDIANFYDCIQHDLLEKKIRLDADYHESGVLDLLMYFLGYSNRLTTKYQRRSVGIPQDAFGDCSRLLANYYLQDYDLYMSSLSSKMGATYFRYADDQMLFVPSEDVGNDIVQMASRRLSRIGLNINQKKVDVRTLDGLEKYRSFTINDLFAPFGSNKDAEIINQFALQAFHIINTEKDSLKDRGYPLIKRLATSDFNLLTANRRSFIMSILFSEDFILKCKAYQMNTTYSKLRQDEKKDYISIINTLIQTCKHSDFHYEVLAFYRTNKLDVNALELRILELKNDIFEFS